MRHGKTRRVQRGGAPRPVYENEKQVGEYDDKTGKGSAAYDVGRYEGHFLDGKPHGLGTLTYMEYRTNELGEVEFVPTGGVYHGNWSHDARDGHGKMTYADGDVYEGQWHNDTKNGRGDMQFFDKGVLICVYNGEWANDLRHGHGIMTYYPSGDVYDGEWVKDIKNGHGIRRYADGRVYEGGWVNAKRSGKGTITHPTGSSYVGDWLDDQMHGNGRYEFTDGDVYVGELQNGDFSGTGTMRYKLGDGVYNVYVGGWRDDLRNGHGIMTYADGRVFDGDWLRGNVHGPGRLTYANGKIMEGEWHDGEFKRSVATRTRSHELPVHPFKIEAGRKIEDMVALQTHKSPAALITLSDGITHNIQTAIALNERIQIQNQRGIPPTNLFNTPLSEEDVSRLNVFLTLLRGGKKRRNAQKR